MPIYKKLLALLITLTALNIYSAKIDDSKLKIYNVKEFIKHNNKESCWVLMDKYIYDVTVFLADHPGSYKILFKCCGKDCTKGYKDKGIDEAHTKKSHKMRGKMLVGILKEKMEAEKKAKTKKK